MALLTTDPLHRPPPRGEKLMGLSRSTLYLAVARGDLAPPEVIGLRAVAWRESALLAYKKKMADRPRRKPIEAMAAARAKREAQLA